MTIEQVEEFIKNTDGKIFSIKFVKRTTGEVRAMTCRTGVKKHLKGGEPTYDAKAHNLIVVFDMQKQGYRSIPKEGITEIRVAGDWTPVVHK